MPKLPEDVSIEFAGVVKNYHRMHRQPSTLKDVLLHLPFFLKRWRQAGSFTALDGLSFQVRRGESLGICGHNGSGKSTTLGLMAGVLRVTAGRVTVNGRVSPLLQLGAGFHPELSGRDNIYLNGIILGMRRDEVARAFDAIVAFSELADSIDEPMRTYSSGMYLRLGFAVAVHTNPDILLVDEALTVGDLAFQQKCLDKMAEFRRSGVTLILVTHRYDEIKANCDRSLLLHKGKIAALGTPEEVEPKYLEVTGSGT